MNMESLDNSMFHKLFSIRCVNSEDQCRVLDSRDKIIRQSLGGKRKSKHTIGTCPDMCPEKERLLRDLQRQISVFERSNYGENMNHSIAVKQYIRSSADQEFPLAHELRPVSVLRFTMRYLLNHIVDLPDTSNVNLSEWYLFVWNRTRAIRKDITQQDLCCLKSVELVEQCARFHIHCSGRLVAEDISIFDEKINSENLTKCIQSLKYMYHDLALNKIQCPNESEFRAYFILLNLNDANFLYELKQLPKEIQRSENIQFAIKVYLAFEENNYVRFFKLVQKTDYLKACILMRYFNQVRVQAIVRTLKAFSSRSVVTLYPLSRLYDILGFESLEETSSFVNSFGLSLSDDNLNIIFDRKSFDIPEVSLKLNRCINLVESKRIASVGQIIYDQNKVLPCFDFSTYVPYSSFDENGFLKPLSTDTINLSNIVMVNENMPTESDVEMETENEKEKMPNFFTVPYGYEQVDSPLKINADIYTMTPVVAEVPNEPLSQFSVAKKTEDKPTIAVETTPKISPRQNFVVSEKTFRPQQLFRNDKHLEQELNEKHKSLGEMEFERFKNEIKVVKKQQNREKIEKFRKAADFIKTIYVFIKWREYAIENRNKKSAVLRNCSRNLRKRPLQDLVEDYKFPGFQDVLTLRKRYKYGHSISFEIEDQFESAQIDVPSLVYKDLYQRHCDFYQSNSGVSPNRIFWKIVFSYSQFDISTSQLMQDCLQWEEKRMCHLKSTNIDCNRSFVYCLKYAEKYETNNGLIFIANSCVDADFSQRLRCFLESRNRNHNFPIAIIFRNKCPNSRKINETALKTLIAADTAYKVFYEHQNNFKDLIEESLQYLAKLDEKTPPLFTISLRQFITNEVGQEFWFKIIRSCLSNRNLKAIFRQPNAVIDLYNEAIDNISILAFDVDNYEYADFADEFRHFINGNHYNDNNKDQNVIQRSYPYLPENWKHPDFINELNDAIEKLHLPAYKYSWPPRSITQLHTNFSKYFQSDLKEDGVRLELLLQRTLCFISDHDFDKSDFAKSMENFSWLNLIPILVMSRIEHVDPEMMVVYNQNDLNQYKKEPWWYESETFKRQCAQVENLQNELSNFDFDLDLDFELEKQNNLKEFLDKYQNSSKQYHDIKELHSDLFESIRITNLVDEKFGRLISKLK